MHDEEVIASVWSSLFGEVEKQAIKEPVLSGFLNQRILSQHTFQAALNNLITYGLTSEGLGFTEWQDTVGSVLADHFDLVLAAAKDLHAILQRDPAVELFWVPFLYHKGYLALQIHRIAHALWKQERYCLALFIQSSVSRQLSMDIHPEAKLGSGIMIDHGTGIVIGQTAVIEDNVSLLHNVTLGGTGKEKGDRHPKIRQGVLIGAGATVLGNIEIGRCAKVAAGSVVLASVPERVTVAGVPAKIVSQSCCDEVPALAMHHSLD